MNADNKQALIERCERMLALAGSMRFISMCSLDAECYRIALATLTVAPVGILPGWIACNERMPEVDGGYLTWDGMNVRSTVLFFSMWHLKELVVAPITHWMPLPAPPAAEGE